MTTRKPLPTFCKFIINPSSSHLALPHAFVSKHLKKNIPKNPTLVSATGGFLWKLEIKKIGGDYCFANGWNQVVKDARLGFEDFLVFWLIDSSTFRVSFFGPHGCEKDLSTKTYNAQCDSCGKTKCNLNVKTVIKIEDDDDEDYEEEEEDDDDYVDGTFNRKNVIQIEVDTDDDDDDDDDADEDGDPIFQRVISDKTNKYFMALPKEFAEVTGLNSEKSVRVMDLEGREWLMNVHSPENLKHKRYWLSSGWPIFREHNELSDGDECFFKFIRSQRRLTLVSVIKKNGVFRKREIRPPRDRKTHSPTPAAEVSKRKRGRPKGSGKKVVEPDVEVMKRKRGRPRGSFRCVNNVKKNEMVQDVAVAKRTRSCLHPEKSKIKYF